MKGIVDLHFHDLRHEGVSRLFEMDWTYPGSQAYLVTVIGTRCGDIPIYVGEGMGIRVGSG